MHLSRTRRRALLAAALPAAIAAFALPGAAQAANVSTGGGGLGVFDRGFFSGGSTENNDVTISVQGSSLVVKDLAGVALDSRDGTCVRFSSIEARCVHSRIATVEGNLGAGDDKLQYAAPQGGSIEMGAGVNRVFAGVREAAGRTIRPFAYRGTFGASDAIGYAAATSGVFVDMADGLANDGRSGDLENILGFEQLEGSEFRDTLRGTPGRDVIFGFGERDVIAGGHGDDVFHTVAKDGADDYHGGPGSDTVNYAGRTQPLNVTLDNVANDGETNGRLSTEFDLVRSNVENVIGGFGDDRITSFGTSSRFDGLRGADTLTSGGGADTLIGGPGSDALSSGGGNDIVDARDSEADFVDCGSETDTLLRDVGEGVVRGCETVNVGVLKLAPKRIDAKAGKPARVKLSWRHPEGWRKLRSVTLRLTHDGVAAGEVTIRPRGQRINADGVVKIVRRGTRLTRRGKTVSARLALRIDASMAGQRLGLEVEATDTQGRRQLERNAGTIRVAE